jgi:hypothetical protein
MIAELDRDLEADALYRGKRLTDAGWAAYPGLLRDALASGDDATFAKSLGVAGYWLDQEQSTSSKGKVFFKKVPVNAHETLAEGEFNRFYLRGLCATAIAGNTPTIVVYRAKAVENPRLESEAQIGAVLDAHAVLADLREHTGVDTALGLPPGPNSGLSAHLP